VSSAGGQGIEKELEGTFPPIASKLFSHSHLNSPTVSIF
jgi:hypothetical protein